MGLLENPKLPLVLFVGVLGVVGSAVYLNTRFNFVEIPLLNPDTPEVIIDYPPITKHPTYPGPTSATPRITSTPSSGTTPTPSTSPGNTLPTTPAQQNIQVIAPFLDKAVLCPVSKEPAAQDIIAQTEEKIKPVTLEYQQCNDKVAAEFQTCIDSCSSYLDVACTENCGQTYDPQFTQCDTNHQNKRTALIQSAKTELGKICIVL